MTFARVTTEHSEAILEFNSSDRLAFCTQTLRRWFTPGMSRDGIMKACRERGWEFTEMSLQEVKELTRDTTS